MLLLQQQQDTGSARRWHDPIKSAKQSQALQLLADCSNLHLHTGAFYPKLLFVNNKGTQTLHGTQLARG
jgi:hypothetical protein